MVKDEEIGTCIYNSAVASTRSESYVQIHMYNVHVYCRQVYHNTFVLATASDLHCDQCKFMKPVL